MGKEVRVAVHLVIKDADGKVLCHIRGKDKKIGMPGGMVDKDESIQEALIREIKEEYGIDLSDKVHEIKYLTSVEKDKGDWKLVAILFGLEVDKSEFFNHFQTVANYWTSNQNEEFKRELLGVTVTTIDTLLNNPEMVNGVLYKQLISVFSGRQQ